jgi:glycosyltransferase involved in cell wall biosynthesis
MTAPRFSVVTISFNQGRYLAECMASVLDQAYPHIEYVVVDPGSRDDSRDIIERHRPRLAGVVLEPDRGPADGLNRGFARTRGELLCYVNADDRLLPGALDFAAGYFERHPDIDVLCGTIRIIDSEGRVSPRTRTADRFDLARYAAGICTVGQQATFFRRRAFDAAGGFNVDNRICWDGELLVDMALAGCRFATVRAALGDFRIYPQSITGSRQFEEKLADEHRRIGRKIAARGVRLYSPIEQRVRRLAYKFNPIRHLGYLAARPVRSPA